MTVTRVHHLDCCTMCPRLGRVNSDRTFVGHVLAVETEQSGVILVDTGIGAAARADPERILGRGFTTMFRPELDPTRSARRQLERLGLADEVRHVIVTHLDVDHAGGLSDFPDATVHVHRDELAAATRPGSFNERLRYRAILWDHVPGSSPSVRPARHGSASRSKAAPGLSDDLVAIPAPGPHRGHVAVAVGAPSGWLLHCGDAYSTTRHPPGPCRSARRTAASNGPSPRTGSVCSATTQRLTAPGRGPPTRRAARQRA